MRGEGKKGLAGAEAASSEKRETVWECARANGFTIVSKDSDFQQRSLLYGPPLKSVWLRIGNCTRQQLAQLITVHEQDIRALEGDPHEAVLVLA